MIRQRKAKMAELSTGGFVVLPGGYGTFEEVRWGNGHSRAIGKALTPGLRYWK